jgi:hypothetical protein
MIKNKLVVTRQKVGLSDNSIYVKEVTEKGNTGAK